MKRTEAGVPQGPRLPYLDATEDRSWRLRAACRELDTELFFPIGTTGTAVDDIENAKAICRTCPVQEACLDYAITTNQEFGVWGGTTEEERRKLRRNWLVIKRGFKA